MKKGFKKLGAFLLTAAMMLAMSSTAFAADFEENSEEGVAGNWDDPDTERGQGDTINIKKEIIAFNPNGTTVHAPVVTYTYTVTPASVTALTVTDETGDHTSNTAVTAPVNAGLTNGLIVTGTAAGTAGNASSAVGTLEFTNSSTWTTAAAGDTNEYDVELDFSGVTFTQPGVYRYQIVETIFNGTANEDNYDLVAMEDGAGNILFLDVYVDGNFDIYGYVCMNANASVTPATDTKINGFVDGTAADNADKYYTYDLVLSKDVVNDNYAEANTAFPFTSIFYNTESYNSTFAITKTDGNTTSSVSLDPSATLFGGDIASVKDGTPITYQGIPAGVDVDVYETNIATGVTYNVSTTFTGGTTPTVDNNVISGTAPTSAVAQTTRAAYESTKVTINTAAITTTAAQSVAITNTLLLISPTGFVVRFAPYALVLMGGIFLIVLGVVLYKRTNKEEA